MKMRSSFAPLFAPLLTPLWFAAAVLAQQPGADVAEPDSDLLCQQLCEAQARGAFQIADAIDRLAGRNEAVARTAAAIVRHLWVELPEAFFAGLDDEPVAARRFLEELARAPRLAAAEWVVKQAQERPKRSVEHRLLAIAARPEPMTPEESQLLLQALREHQTGDGFYFAAARLPEQVADRLLGRLHQGLLQGDILVAEAMPLLDRLSMRGTRSLLGLAVSLPEAAARQLLRHVYEVRPELVQERVAAAFDRDGALEALWLEFGRKLLDRPERVARVVAVMVNAESEEVREQAFDLLLNEGVLQGEALANAVAGASDGRIRRILAGTVNTLPSSFVAEWLQSSPEVSADMARALAMRSELAPEVQQQLLAILDGLGAADQQTPLYALTALVHAGDADALQKVWPLLLGSVAWRDLLNRLAQRTEPFVYEVLLAGTQAALLVEPLADPRREAERQQQLDALRLLLVARGDRRELETLLLHAPNREASFIRKCRQYAVSLTAPQAESLMETAFASEDPDVASELLEWVVVAQPELAQRRLWQFYQEPPAGDAAEELLAIAMRLLVSGSHREQLLQQLRDAIAAGPLSEQLSSLPYEALNSMAEPLHETDVQLCAELLLRLPISDGEGELRRVARWPDGTVGFPLVAAIGNRLRTCDALVAEQVFAELVASLLTDARRSNISKQRLKVFWRSLASRPDLQRGLGRITASLWGSSEVGVEDPESAITNGAAVFLQALASEHDQQFGEAERRYQQAVRELLLLPAMRGEARWLLGDRDAMHGNDPLAALSAAPYRMRLLAAQSAQDAAAIAAASDLVREFAGHDRETLATLSTNPVESGR